MQIDIVSVGNLKEKYLQDANKEYLKRLSKTYKINEIELKDESNKLTKNEVLNKEKEKINKVLKDKTFLIVLAIEGKQFSSEEFSKKIENIKLQGYSHITFLIGGSYGVHHEIKSKANMLLSFSKFTFPHQLFKIILLEQIYRAMKIEKNEVYHK